MNMRSQGKDTPQPTLKGLDDDSQEKPIRDKTNESVLITNNSTAKSITHRDQIHGDIILDPLAVALLNTPALQRLGRIYQLGYAHLVFRGGTHTRLSHVIGAFHMATKLVDALKQNYIYRSHSLLPGIERPKDFLPLPSIDSAINERWQFLRYTTSWAALLHDVGHIPMGHTLEDEFDNIYIGHDNFLSERIPHLWHETEPGRYSDIYTILHDETLYPDAFRALDVKPHQVWQTVMLICLYKEKRHPNSRSFNDLLEEAISVAKNSERKTFATIVQKQLAEADNKTFFPYMVDIVGNTICADYLDYLRRDAFNVGLDVLRDDRVISHFYVARDSATKKLRMALALLDRNGKRRLDTCTGVLELVRQRFRFAEIIYYHKSKVAASAMFAKALSLIGKPPEVRKQQTVLNISDIPILAGELSGKNGSKTFNDLRASCLPTSLMDPEIGDESLHLVMQHIAWDNIKRAQKNNNQDTISKNLGGIALLQGISRRHLYKTKMTIDSSAFATLSPGTEQSDDVERRIGQLLEKLRSTEFERDQLEQEMCESAGWPHYAILLYVPPRKSQAKGIDTYALQHDGIVTLGMHEAVREKVRELNNDYRNLWRIVLLVSPDRAKDALGLSKAVDKMLQSMWPDIDLRNDTIASTVSLTCWFPYIKEQERLAAETYMQMINRADITPEWEAFIRVRHYTVQQGTPSTEEHANRAYLMSILGANNSTENLLRAKFPIDDMVCKLVEKRRLTVETREKNSDALEVQRQALEAIAEEIRST